MKKYVDGEYIPMTPEEIAVLKERAELYPEEATEADYQKALAEFGVKV